MLKAERVSVDMEMEGSAPSLSLSDIVKVCHYMLSRMLTMY